MSFQRIVLALLCLALGATLNHLSAQITDDFSDGDFLTDPIWQGDVSDFMVNPSGMLQLDAPDAGESSLTVSGTIPDSVVWEFDLLLEFAPSNQNLIRIYLQSDQSDLSMGSGYFLEIGESGSQDAIRLFRQDAGTPTLLITGTPGFVASDPVDIRISIRHTATGSWIIAAGEAGGVLANQGSTIDQTYAGGANLFFGLHCLYTDSRKDKFYFDNLSILPDIPDTEPPVLLSAAAIDDQTVDVRFSEPLDPGSALNADNYQISGLGTPMSASWVPGSEQEVRLNLSTGLGTGTYTLSADQVRDTSGNIAGIQSVNFDFLKIDLPETFDILINEIMADPSPSRGLPNVEWLEVINTSAKVINLNTLRLSDGGTPRQLPDYLLKPDSILVLTSTSNADTLLSVTPNVLAMSGFPGLNNGGDSLQLTAMTGETIDYVYYSDQWHTEPDKVEGGWTLERINPMLPCLGQSNWRSCPVLPGGTPGLPNAALQLTPDTEAPRLVAAFPQTPFKLLLVYSEGLDPVFAQDPASYAIEPQRMISEVKLSDANFQLVEIILSEPIESGVLYTVSSTSLLQDCSGNSASSDDFVQLGLPAIPAAQDIIVNEVLFDPQSGGKDFVEILNVSDSIFSLKNLFLANFEDGFQTVQVGLDRLLLPGEYLVFSDEPVVIEDRFQNVISTQLVDLSLPSLPDDSGNVTLYWSDGNAAITIDSFNYKAEYHNALYSSSERAGVSLERIDPLGETNVATNWTSAAFSAFGSGTPTLPNSQRMQTTGTGVDLIELPVARLSPDADGFEDFLTILYNVPAPGYSAKMIIYDSNGIPVRQLLRSALLGVTGSLRWEGDLDDGTLARPGIYILYLELFSPDGTVERVKKTFSVVKRF